MSAIAIEPKIGGLPASRFEGRRVKAKLPDEIFATVICRGSHKKSILVDAVIQGRLQPHQVSPAHVKPNWVENEDLQREALALESGGDVNAALEAAEEEARKKALKSRIDPAWLKPKPTPPEPTPPTPEVMLPTPPPVQEETPPPPPVLEEVVVPEVVPAPKPTPVGCFTEITGVQASITADPSWMSDFKDLQTLIASSRDRSARLTALRIELQELESREGEDDDMIELYVETLMQKGVVIQRGAPMPLPAPAAKPVSSFGIRVSNWLEMTKPERFTFEQASTAAGVVDNCSRRGEIRAAAAAAGYGTIPSKRGQPLVFVKEVPGA